MTTQIKQLFYWQLAIIILIFTIVIIGGITRLTGSGLSMVDWQPIMGIIPPLNTQQWNNVFLQYQQFPEFIKLNQSMSLSEFKFIYFWEYLHRILGRLIGLTIIIPFIVFKIQKKLSKELTIKASIMTFLVITQGVVGWYMVKSGLINVPHVSHFRLAIHLGLAIVLLEYCIWTALTIISTKTKQNTLSKILKLWVIGLGIQIIYGAFTAGLHAGWGYNTYPKMGDNWIPEAAFMFEPFIKNTLYNPVMIQFIHRHLALILGISFFIIWKKINTSTVKQSFTRILNNLALILLILQICLGILTLIWVVPIKLALMHQFLAVILLSTVIVLIHSMSHTYNWYDGKKSK